MGTNNAAAKPPAVGGHRRPRPLPQSCQAGEAFAQHDDEAIASAIACRPVVFASWIGEPWSWFMHLSVLLWIPPGPGFGLLVRESVKIVDRHVGPAR